MVDLGKTRSSFLLSVLGIGVTVGHRVDGVVPPEEKSAGRQMIIITFGTKLFVEAE